MATWIQDLSVRAGENWDCTFTNRDLPASVSVTTHVSGGTAVPGQFVLGLTSMTYLEGAHSTTASGQVTVGANQEPEFGPPAGVNHKMLWSWGGSPYRW